MNIRSMNLELFEHILSIIQKRISTRLIAECVIAANVCFCWTLHINESEQNEQDREHRQTENCRERAFGLLQTTIQKGGE